MAQAAPLIVVVDDDRPIADLICELLSDAGYSAQVCHSVPTAYQLLEHVTPALIITDLWMDYPESGWSFIQRLRQTSAYAKLPLILCAANAVFLRAHAQELEAFDCGVVEKPFNVNDLLREVAVRLGARHNPPGASLGTATADVDRGPSIEGCS